METWESLPNEEYRYDLAKDLKEIRADDRELAKKVLEGHKKTSNYEYAEEDHRAEVEIERKRKKESALEEEGENNI